MERTWCSSEGFVPWFVLHVTGSTTLRLCAVAALVFSCWLWIWKLSRASEEQIRSVLLGKHVWITGGNQGLGLALALQALQAGARVTISARNSERLFAAAASLGGNIRVVATDVTRSDDLCRAHKEVERGHGAVDIAIANAGINHKGLPFVKISEVDAQAVVMTNLLGTIRMFQLVLPSMLARNSGVLCAVSSLAGYRGVPGASVYGCTKAGITSLCQSLGVELYGSGVEICCVHPGFIDTPAISKLSHPKPFLMQPSEAAREIMLSIARKRHHVGFPWPMEFAAARMSALMPSSLYEWILSKSAKVDQP